MALTGVVPLKDDAPLIHLSTDFIRAKEYLEAIVASTSDAIVTTDIRGRVIFFSPGAEKMLGIPTAAALGRPVHLFYPGGREEAQGVMKLLRKDGAFSSREMALNTAAGGSVHVSMSASLLKDRAGRVIGTLGISKDITSRVELENKLRELTITDNLTGLFNQRHFHERLESEAGRAKRQKDRLSLILIDLDGFKQANDLWGHLEGDRILKCFASVLSQVVRKGVDSAFRYGGDEFVVLLPGLPAVKAEKVAGRITAATEKTCRGGVGFSYGIATLTPAGSLPDLVRLADRRMFKMKAAKKRLSRGAASSVLRAVVPPHPA